MFTAHYIREIEYLNNAGSSEIKWYTGYYWCNKSLHKHFSEWWLGISSNYNFIISLLQIILMFNIFKFNSDMFRQLIGTGMGATCTTSTSSWIMKLIRSNIFSFGILTHPHWCGVSWQVTWSGYYKNNEICCMWLELDYKILKKLLNSRVSFMCKNVKAFLVFSRLLLQ